MASELEQLKDLYDLMLEKNLDTLEIKDEDGRIKLTRRLAPVPGMFAMAHHAAPQPIHAAAKPAAPAPSSAPAASIPSIESPLAGVFYRSNSPTSAPFVKEGDIVDAGQTLCIIEAMKVMNEIKAESHCKIKKIVAENGRSVSAGQALFHIDPA